MQRFTNFNQILSEQSGNDDDDDDDDDDNQEYIKGDIGDEEDKNKNDESDLSSDFGTRINPVVIPLKTELVTEYSDQAFWKVDTKEEAEIDYDALLAELDS